MAEKRASSRGRGSGGKSGDQGERLAGAGWQTAIIDGATFSARPVQYTVVDDLAIFEGDIVLGTADEVARRTQAHRDAIASRSQFAVIVTGANRRWENCQVPFTIDPALPNQARVTDAIAHWEANTRFRFVPRTTHGDWITFRPGTGCSSMVGRQGGQQFINLAAGCPTGSVIHEIGHAVGLWHEQSREDRDAFVTIHWDKIDPGMEHNFDQHITDGDDVGAYDYGSIMHYPRDAFSRDGSDTITPADPSATIGQRNGLSAGDIAALNTLCPVLPTFKEAPGDQTIKEVRSDPTFKEPPRDQTFKEVAKDPITDTVKEQIVDTFKEAAGDPKGPFDPGPGTFVERVGPITGPIGGGAPGGPAPFAVATGHQAPALAGAGDPAAQIAQLDAQLQQLAEALNRLEGDRAALQQQYDETAAALAAAIRAAGGPGA
jgi:hypothetical protein